MQAAVGGECHQQSYSAVNPVSYNNAVRQMLWKLISEFLLGFKVFFTRKKKHMSCTRNLSTTPLLQRTQTPEVNLLAVFCKMDMVTNYPLNFYLNAHRLVKLSGLYQRTFCAEDGG